ncbi:beta-L-arabinofuranosidase domain-containing protein [Kribbella sp. NPDC048928]|uniref:beta-L-arabinofuranosidase domain-containing protein n=1 Tax=Kribbella sp. NPDC048928 TaxID=3364111 RepID=UPI0037186052
MTSVDVPDMPGTARYAELPLGAIEPRGWLERQLRLQADNITGRLPELWEDVSARSGWLGGQGESWERGPYYLDGLVPLGHVLHDAGLIKQAEPWIEWMLASQRPDGMFGPAGNNDWWPRMVALKVLTQHADATGDERVADLISRYAEHQLRELHQRPLRDWGQARGAENALSIWWLYDRRPDPRLRELAAVLQQQTTDWRHFLGAGLPKGKVTRFSHPAHGPNVAMALRSEAVWYLNDAQADRAERAREQLDQVLALHGQAHGWFSGDEWLGGRAATQGLETCQVVESMFTASTNLRVFGDTAWGDDLELLAFNHLPASSDPELRAHQYLQQANQIAASVDRRAWSYSTDDANIFGLEPHFGCCTANLHQGWPKYVRSLWLADDAGLVAMSYAPCHVRAELGGVPVMLDVETGYPFEETARISVGVAGSGVASGTLAFRIPRWCVAPDISVNGTAVPGAPEYVRIDRSWQDGDVVTVRLPQEVRTSSRENGAVSIGVGPLVMVSTPGENWFPIPEAPGLGEWHVHPRNNWNIGVVVDGPRGRSSWQVHRGAVPDVPFHRSSTAVGVEVTGGQIPGWNRDGADSAPPPAAPDDSWVVIEPHRLVPYGTARLRITELPVLAEQPRGTD